LISSNVLPAQIADNKENIIKINVPALFLKNISFQYERKLSAKNSFVIAVRFRPKSTIAFQSTLEKLIDQPAVRVDLFKMGNFGITPEYRFYLGKKTAPLGFYIAPFISYNHYNANVPVNYDSLTKQKTAVFTGSQNTFTAGFQLGVQWKLSDKIYLDLWIVGPNYGLAKGDFTAALPLNDDEQLNMFFQLFKLTEGINPKIIKSFDVNANGASFKVNGPWGGIRAMGINIGYRF
jgi:hypothetical protein